MTAAPTAMHDVVGRISSIQARIEELTGADLTGSHPAFQAALAAAEGPDAGEATRRASGTPGTRLDGVSAAAATPDGGPTAVPGNWAQQLSADGQRWAPAIQSAGEDAGIDPALLASVVQHESNFNPNAVSHAGAIGLAQLMPGTAAGLGVDPHDPHENLAGGARYLKTQLDRFGDVELALAAYNAGPNRVAQAGGIPRIQETQTYVQRVTATYRELS